MSRAKARRVSWDRLNAFVAAADCMEVPPSMTPRRAGERAKTDWRDALMLARRARAGDLAASYVPDERDGLHACHADRSGRYGAISMFGFGCFRPEAVP